MFFPITSCSFTSHFTLESSHSFAHSLMTIRTISAKHKMKMKLKMQHSAVSSRKLPPTWNSLSLKSLLDQRSENCYNSGHGCACWGARCKGSFRSDPCWRYRTSRVELHPSMASWSDQNGWLADVDGTSWFFLQPWFPEWGPWGPWEWKGWQFNYLISILV